MNETPSRRHLGFAALTLWIALPGAWSCAESRPRRDTAGAEDTVQVLYYSANSETWQDFGQPVLTLLFMPLMHEHGGDMEGRLARSREMSADGRAWTYHLRTDVRWHDGVPVTAHDIEFTIKLFQNLDHRNPLAAQRGLGRTVEVIDDSTFTITFELYRDDFVWTPREVFLPSHLLEGLDPADMAEWEFWNAPVGNGPYRFVRMIPNEFIELEASPDYFAGPPGIQRVFLRAGGAWMTMLHAGEVDILTEVGGLTAASLADDPRYRIYQWPSSRPGRITWNHRHPILGDPRVRRALSLTVDRGELAVISGYPADLPTWDVPANYSPRPDGKTGMETGSANGVARLCASSYSPPPRGRRSSCSNSSAGSESTSTSIVSTTSYAGTDSGRALSTPSSDRCLATRIASLRS